MRPVVSTTGLFRRNYLCIFIIYYIPSVPTLGWLTGINPRMGSNHTLGIKPEPVDAPVIIRGDESPPILLGTINHVYSHYKIKIKTVMTNEIIYVIGIMFSAFIFALVSIGDVFEKEKAKQ